VLDHIGIGVSDLGRSRAFYEQALKPLGISVIMDVHVAVGFGRDRKPFFWIAERESVAPVHVAFLAPDRATVDAFHAAGLEAGGADNGPPGIREIYHPNYYGAFIHYPDGHNIEAVKHTPE
jgi:catechol 2,3-dioxygenase-like lactoylglutathione lyase family enzyme